MGEVTVMENPVDRNTFFKQTVVSLLLLTVAMAPPLLTIQRWSTASILVVALAVAFAIGFPLYMGWSKEYSMRPYRIEIRDDGLLLRRHYHREPTLVRWDGIISFFAPPGDPAKQTKRYSRDGSIVVKNEAKRNGEDFYLLHWPIAIAVKERYRETTGEDPPHVPVGERRRRGK